MHVVTALNAKLDKLPYLARLERLMLTLRAATGASAKAHARGVSDALGALTQLRWLQLLFQDEEWVYRNEETGSMHLDPIVQALSGLQQCTSIALVTYQAELKWPQAMPKVLAALPRLESVSLVPQGGHGWGPREHALLRRIQRVDDWD
jgi:hypothetical protein